MHDADISVTLTRRSDGELLFAGATSHGALECESLEPGGLRLLETAGA